MPNLKSAKKRVKTDAIKRLRNNGVKSTMRTFVKKTDQSIAAGDQENASLYIKKAFSHLDRAAQKGLVHKNYANRHKTKLAEKLSALLS